MFELIIFDCDGVLIDSEWLANQVEVEELSKLGLEISIEEYFDLALGRTNDEVEEGLRIKYRFQLPQNYWQHVKIKQEKEFQERLKPIPGIKEIIQSLSIPCCVASSSDTNRLDLTLKIAGLYSDLDGKIFGRECVNRGKPEPDIFLHAASNMNVNPKNFLVIEDSIHGIHAATAAGMEVWAFCGGRHFSPKRRKTLDHSNVGCVFDDMHSLWTRIQKKLNLT